MNINLCLILLAYVVTKIKCGKDWSEDQNPEKWYDDAKRNIEHILNRQLNGKIAKNVILFLGDGMGI